MTPDPRLRSISQLISEKLSLSVVYIGRNYRHKLYRTSFVSLEEYLWLFSHAEMILTNSFHGTVFSLIFQKQFYVLPPEGEETRIVDVLDIFGLQSRVLPFPVQSVDNLEGSIDYESVSKILVSEKERSLDFLRVALSDHKLEDLE